MTTKMNTPVDAKSDVKADEKQKPAPKAPMASKVKGDTIEPNHNQTVTA